MFSALWLNNNGQYKPISAEEALKLDNYKEESFISNEKDDWIEKLKDESIELTEKEFKDLFSVKIRKGCTKTSKNNKIFNVRPCFERYYNIEDYRKLFPSNDRKYEIIKKLIHLRNSEWHEKWVESLDQFCTFTEKRVTDNETNTYMYPDALYKDTNTIFEVQHSYIGESFKKRNEFYKKLGYQVVWIIDGTKIKPQISDNYITIIENDNLNTPLFKLLTFDITENDIIYVQLKNRKIYRIYNPNQLLNEDGLGSAIWTFIPIEIYDNKDIFIESIKNKTNYQDSIINYNKKIKEKQNNCWCEEDYFNDINKPREIPFTDLINDKNDDEDDYITLKDVVPVNHSRIVVIENKYGNEKEVYVEHYPKSSDKPTFLVTYKSYGQFDFSKKYPISGDTEVLELINKPKLFPWKR